MPAIVEAVRCDPLSVPLVDPFVIASGRVDATRNILVSVRLREGARVAEGLGEGSCLPPVTREDQPDAIAAVERARPHLEGQQLDPEELSSLTGILDATFAAHPVARSAVEMALLDAAARLRNVPLYLLLNPDAAPPPTLETDITLPILTPSRMAELATEWWAKGFRSFKVKVGRALEDDLEALRAISRRVPRARFRVDANGGYSVEAALAFFAEAERLQLSVECFEQPCATDDLDAMAQVAAATRVPVLADESVKTLSDFVRLRDRRACGGVNLKIAKSGGLLAAYEIGRAARAAGMVLMVGGMVETRLGMTAATHLAAALGKVEFPDLDTAWLLRADPFTGGYREEGPTYTLTAAGGLDVTRAA